MIYWTWQCGANLRTKFETSIQNMLSGAEAYFHAINTKFHVSCHTRKKHWSKMKIPTQTILHQTSLICIFQGKSIIIGVVVFYRMGAQLTISKLQMVINKLYKRASIWDRERVLPIFWPHKRKVFTNTVYQKTFVSERYFEALPFITS